MPKHALSCLSGMEKTAWWRTCKHADPPVWSVARGFRCSTTANREAGLQPSTHAIRSASPLCNAERIRAPGDARVADWSF
jgi:hypothetical protein